MAMPLPIIIAISIFTYGCSGISLLLLSLCILGKRAGWRFATLYGAVYCALQWGALGVLLLAEKTETQMPFFWNIAAVAVQAAVLCAAVKGACKTPLAKTVAAVALSNFVVVTFSSVSQAAVLYYAPFWGNYSYAAITILMPAAATLLLALLATVVLRRSEFHRHFAHLFTGGGKTAATLAVCLVLMFLWAAIDLANPDAEQSVPYALGFFALIVAGLLGFQFTAMYAAGQEKIRAQEETIRQQQAHLALLEELQQEFRAFKHDLTNLLSGAALQAQQGDLAGVQAFMKNTGGYFDEKLGGEIQQLEGLAKVQPFPLRSMLTAKLAAMRQRDISAQLEVLLPVTGAEIGTEDLIRCLGILLDNALEAAAIKGIVRIMLLQQEQELHIAVSNTFEDAPDLRGVQQRDYTTKGAGRGTGLSSYRKILAGYPGCVARTYLRDGFFTQELRIPA